MEERSPQPDIPQVPQQPSPEYGQAGENTWPPQPFSPPPNAPMSNKKKALIGGCGGCGGIFILLVIIGALVNATSGPKSASIANSPAPSPTHVVSRSTPKPSPTHVVSHSTPKPTITAFSGLGSPLTIWSKAHHMDQGKVLCSDANSCFGPSVNNPTSGDTYEFTNVTVTDGVVSGFDINYPNNTTIEVAEQTVVSLLPGGSASVFTYSSSGCLLMNYEGSALAKSLGTPKIGDPQGVVGVEFNSINAQGNSFYNPENVQTASLSVLPEAATSSC